MHGRVMRQRAGPPSHGTRCKGDIDAAKRIFLVHPTLLAMPPVDEAFKTLWPDAKTINVLDESLYNDIPQDGTLAPEIYERSTNLFRHCELSGADGIVFSGSTFGPAVEEARKGVHDAGAAHRGGDDGRGGRARRRDPARLHPEARAAGGARHARCRGEAAPASRSTITELWVSGARDALNNGDNATHDRLIAEQSAAAGEFDLIVFGMMSMAPARAKMPPALARRRSLTQRRGRGRAHDAS